MLFALICHDKPGALETRTSNRDSHLAYIAETGCVSLAGPLLNAAEEMSGSLIVLDVTDRAAAERWAGADPYARAGLFERVEIHGWKRVVG